MSRRLKIGCPIVIAITLAAIVIPLRTIKARVLEVEVEPAKLADIDETVSAVPVGGQPAGTVKPDEVKVIPKTGGELVNLLVEEGDSVQAGQVIAYLDARAVQAELRQAQATATAARARLAQTAAEAQAAPARASTAVTEARAALQQAEAKYRTTVRGARSEEVRQAQETVVQAGQDLAEAEANLATARRGARPEEIAAGEASLRQAQAQARSARANLSLLQAGGRAEDIAKGEAALRDAQAQLGLRQQELDSQRALHDKGFVSRNALRAAEAAYEAALAARDSAREQLALARKPYRAEELEQAEASLRGYEEAVKSSEANLAVLRTRTTPEELAAAQARRAAAASRLSAARAALRLTETQTTPEDLQSARAAVSQSHAAARRAEANRVSVREARLDVAMNAADLRRAEAALQQAAERAGYTVITAPLTGVVTRINSKRGEYVQGGEIALPSAEMAMLVITATSRTWIECNVDEADINDVRLGQPATIFLGEGKQLPARVHQISPSVRETQGDVRTFAVKLAVTGNPARLRSGMSVDVDITVRSRKQVLSVPSFAILDEGGKRYVYVLEAGKVKKKEVTRGVEGIERTEISKGLRAGESVITSLEVGGLRDGRPAKVATKKKDKDAKEKGTEDRPKAKVEVGP